MFLNIKDVTKESLFSTKMKFILLTYFLLEQIFGIQSSHVHLKKPNVVQLNPDEDKFYLFTPYPTLMPPLKNFFLPENIRAIAENPNIKLKSIGLLQIRYKTSSSHTTVSRTPYTIDYKTKIIHR